MMPAARSGFPLWAAIAVVLGVISMMLPGTASAQTPIRFSIDWRFEAPNAGFLVALDKGFYKAEGLDVTIDPGNGSVDGINRVASGSYQLAMADINSLIRYRDNPANPAIRGVFMVLNAPAFAIMSMRKSGIGKPRDLEGRVLGAPAADAGFANWAAFVRAAGIDSSKVRIENVGFPVREPMLMQGKVDAIVGFGYSAVVALQTAGVKPEDVSVMYMRDFGLELYGNTLIAGPQFMKENPEALRRFIRASIRGFLDAAANPADAYAAVLKRNPVTTEAAERTRFSMFMNDNLLTPEVRANGIGHVDPARMARSIDQLGESFKFTSKLRLEDFYTEAFLPARADRQIPAAILNRKY